MASPEVTALHAQANADAGIVWYISNACCSMAYYVEGRAMLTEIISMKPGDIVQLRTGGPAMTAGEHHPVKGRRCAWSVKDDIKEGFFSEAMLRPYEEENKALRISFADSFEPDFRAVLDKIAAGTDNPQELASAVLLKANTDPGKGLEDWRQRRSEPQDHCKTESDEDQRL